MSFQGDSIFWVEVEKVVPNPFQPRREFDQERLQELADSIRMYGVLQPLTVTKREVNKEDGSFHSEYELIAGERRLRASKLAGVELVPVIIRSGEQTEQEKLELAIIENLQREDLNAVDRALAFKQLAEMFELSHGQVAKKVGRSREYVSNSIRLLALPEHMLASLKQGDMSEGHARTLLMLKDKPEEQEVVFKEILLKKLSVREVERIARKIATDKVRKKHWSDADAHLIELERAFTDTLGTRVQILKTEFGGKLTIDYFSESDLQTLLSAMATSQAKIHVDEPENYQGDSATVITELPVTQPQAETDEMASIAEATPLQTAETKHESVDQPVVPEEAPQTPETKLSTVQTAPIPEAPETSAVTESPVIETPAPSAPQQPSVQAPPEPAQTAPSHHEPAEPVAEQPVVQSEASEPITTHQPLPEAPSVANIDGLQQTINQLSEAVDIPDDEQTRLVHQGNQSVPDVGQENESLPNETKETPQSETEKKSPADDELYSLKNFSI